MDIVPSDKRKLRSCMLCALIKTQAQFKAAGCDNCEQVLRLKQNNDRIMDCTSANFDGMIALIGPERSWVGRWQRIDKFAKGLYAIRVGGQLPVHIEEELQDKGIKYRPRDGSILD